MKEFPIFRIIAISAQWTERIVSQCWIVLQVEIFSIEGFMKEIQPVFTEKKSLNLGKIQY